MAKTTEKLRGALALAAGGLLLVGAGCAKDDVKPMDAAPEAPTDEAVEPKEAMREAASPSVSEIVVTKTQDSADALRESPTKASTGVTSVKATASDYKDGTYSAVGDYTYHSGPESITITITLANDIITDTTFKGVPNVAPSQKFMDMFAGGYKELVIGKDIDEVHLDKVSGSSRTPIGFNDALEKIKLQAKAL
jgi:uncharacterized protein with FMN-binding domain